MFDRLLFAVVVVAVANGESCVPESNCKLPACRCAGDKNIPGRLSRTDTPQMVLVTFEDVVNEENAEEYRSMFKQSNPNGCPPRGTFFLRHEGSDYFYVNSLHNDGHEFGVGSVNGSVPQTGEDWRYLIKYVKERLMDVGIKSGEIKGIRAPTLAVGGLDEFIAMGDNGLDYDASCITSQFTMKENLKWPYTYDYVDDLPQCNIGTTLSTPFAGKWQFLIPEMNYKGMKCAVPQGCTNVRTERDTFDMLFENFIKHYEGKKTPFVIVVTADFVRTDYKLLGITQFLEFVRAAFEDTWIITAEQALQWIREPTKNADLNNFGPWKC